LQLANSGNAAAITVSAGSQTISAPVDMASSVVVSPAAGSKLTISGGITGPGKSLTVNAPGTVVLQGANSYTGGTNVSAGKLIVQNAASIESGTNLTVGADAASLFGNSLAASAPATAGPSIPGWAGATSATAPLASLPVQAVFKPAVRLAVGKPTSSQAAPAMPANVATVDRFGQPAKDHWMAANVAWWVQAGDNTGATFQDQNRAVSTQALDAVFAEYVG
jgi:autotransporter-associated beta strand protein